MPFRIVSCFALCLREGASMKLKWKKKKNSPLKEHISHQVGANTESFRTPASESSQAVNDSVEELSIISSPTSARMAQSSRGALETLSESSALLSVLRLDGPWSSLANWSPTPHPPHALCAIKDNCANDILQHFPDSSNRGRCVCQANWAYYCSHTCTTISCCRFTKWLCGIAASQMGLKEEYRQEKSLETSEEGVKRVQLVLTSRSTHIAPEGGAAFIRLVWTHMHCSVHSHSHTCACLHREGHTQTSEGEPKLAELHSQASAEPLTFSPLSYGLLSVRKRRSISPLEEQRRSNAKTPQE